MMSSAAETSSRHFFDTVSTIKMGGHALGGWTNLYDIVQNSNERIAVLVLRRQFYILHHLTQEEEYLPLNPLGFVTLVSHPQGRREGVLLQPGGVWSRRNGALL